MDLKEIDILADGVSAHWYYRAKAEAMRRLLEGARVRSVLDVGAGSGFFSRHLLATTDVAEACCVDPSYEADRDETESGKPLHFRRNVDAADADLVLMMDVLDGRGGSVRGVRHGHVRGRADRPGDPELPRPGSGV